MEKIEISIGGRDFVFKIEFVDDSDAGTPWENSDGHGPVSEWTRRSKRPGERVLNSDSRGDKRFYDYQSAIALANSDGWGHGDDIPGETKKQKAARAVDADFEYLRAWCNDEWTYVGVIVTLLDDDGEKTEINDSLWCVETSSDYHHEVARQLADEIAHGYGTRWTEQTEEKTTFVYFSNNREVH